MKQRIFNVLQAINASDLDNGQWAIVNGTENTQVTLATAEVREINEPCICYWHSEHYNEVEQWSHEEADLTLHAMDSNELIEVYIIGELN